MDSRGRFGLTGKGRQGNWWGQMKAKKKVEVPEYPKVIETFCEPHGIYVQGGAILIQRYCLHPQIPRNNRED